MKRKSIYLILSSFWLVLNLSAWLSPEDQARNELIDKHPPVYYQVEPQRLNIPTIGEVHFVARVSHYDPNAYYGRYGEPGKFLSFWYSAGYLQDQNATIDIYEVTTLVPASKAPGGNSRAAVVENNLVGTISFKEGVQHFDYFPRGGFKDQAVEISIRIYKSEMPDIKVISSGMMYNDYGPGMVYMMKIAARLVSP